MYFFILRIWLFKERERNNNRKTFYIANSLLLFGTSFFLLFNQNDFKNYLKNFFSGIRYLLLVDLFFVVCQILLSVSGTCHL